MKIRKLLVLVAILAAMVLIGGLAPVSAAPQPGGGVGATALSPQLTGIPHVHTLPPFNVFPYHDHAGDGFPCAGGGGIALDAIGNWASSTAVSYGCLGFIYPGGVPGVSNEADFAGAGVNGGTPWSFAGRGTISGTYTYSEPCQVILGNNEAATGEAAGTLTLTLTGVGVVGFTPITAAKVTVGFFWSRVGLTAIVGLQGAIIDATSPNLAPVTDSQATGLAAAVFVPNPPPNCNVVSDPPAGAINIFSGTLSVG